MKEKIYTHKPANRIDRLIHEFLNAGPRYFLSKEDIRQDVLFYDDASEGSIRQLVCDARKVLIKENRKWEIVTICHKGYQLRRLKRAKNHEESLTENGV